MEKKPIQAMKNIFSDGQTRIATWDSMLGKSL